jgi:23S rRNA (adenine-N6)-dimethyltransferase
MSPFSGGRHEHGQNFLIDSTISAGIIGMVTATDGPIVEIGPGRGALTLGLQCLDRPLTAVEIDGGHVRWLRARASPSTSIVHGDFLRWRLPARPHVIVGNLPFHQTTAMLRKLLHAPHWTQAVLLVQWEVARRRAGVGGATMMTAQWWPWFEFGLHGRVPAIAFRPRPTVDAGLLTVTRRPESLLDADSRRSYQGFVHAVFTGRGRGLPAVLAAVCDRRRRRHVTDWLIHEGLDHRALPKDLSPIQWVELYRIASAQRRP